jgi:hypothetical protein
MTGKSHWPRLWAFGLFAGAILLATSGPAWADDKKPVAPYGLVFYDNAVPAGLDATDWKWRAIYATKPDAKQHVWKPPTTVSGPVKPPVDPGTEWSIRPLFPLDYYLYAKSRQAHDNWLNKIKAKPAGGRPAGWGPSCVNGQPPTSVWRLYDRTLFEQDTGAPFAPDKDVPGYEPKTYNVSRYVTPGTLDFNQIPANWWADEFQRQKVLMLAACITGNFYLEDYWATSAEWGHLWDCEYNSEIQHTPIASGEALGAQGVSFSIGMLIFEYALAYTYEDHVIRLEEEAKKAWAKARAEWVEREKTVYLNGTDGRLNLPVIARREIPNYPVPKDVSYQIPASRNAVGGFMMETAEVAAGGQAAEKVVSIEREFTTAAVPFQFTVETSTDRVEAAASDPLAAAEVAGRLFVRLHVPAGAGRGAGAWVEVDGSDRLAVAGTATQPDGDKFVNPWAFVRARDADPYFKQGGSPGGRRFLALSWAGVLTVRASDFQVDCFDRIELRIRAQVRTPAGPAVGPVPPAEQAKARARVAVQPVLSRNIARILGAGDGRKCFAYNQVTLQADTSLMPLDTTRASFTWNWGDGSKEEAVKLSPGSGGVFPPVMGKHYYQKAGDYDVVLKVDPTLPKDAPHAAIFNDPDRGYSCASVRLKAASPAPTTAQETPEIDTQKARKVMDLPKLEPGLYWGRLGFRHDEANNIDLVDPFRVSLKKGQTMRVSLYPRAHFYIFVGGHGLSMKYNDWIKEPVRPEGGVCRFEHQATVDADDYFIEVVMPRRLGLQQGSYLLRLEVAEVGAKLPDPADFERENQDYLGLASGSHYKVKVSTSKEADHGGAGTTARVFLTLYGNNGLVSGEWPLTKSGGPFKAGAEDEFEIFPEAPLGGLCGIRLRHDNTGKSADWHVKDVHITFLKSGKTEPDPGDAWRFTLDRWLATDKDDGRIDVYCPVDKAGG